MYDPHRHHRRSIRLKGWDYSSSRLYFVTICVDGRQCVLGEVKDDDISLSNFGRIAANTISWLESHYEQVIIDAWVVMPNHVHIIIAFVDAANATQKRRTLGQIVSAFKTVSTKQINLLRDGTGNRF